MDENKYDMPQVLKTLEELVQLLKDIPSETNDYSQIDDTITKHIDLLELLKGVTINIAVFKKKTKTEVEAFSDVMKDLFGEHSFISNEAERLCQSCPNISEKDLRVLQLLDDQIEKLIKLRRKLLVDDLIDKVVKKQIKVLMSLPKVFPKGAPIRDSIEKRIRALKK